MIRFQLISWFPEWRGFYCFRWDKDLVLKEKSGMAYIYDWILGFAFWEIRKWHMLAEEECLKLKMGNCLNTDK